MGGRAPGPGLLAPRLAAHVGLARVPVGGPLPGGDQGRSRPSSGALGPWRPLSSPGPGAPPARPSAFSGALPCPQGGLSGRREGEGLGWDTRAAAPSSPPHCAEPQFAPSGKWAPSPSPTGPWREEGRGGGGPGSGAAVPSPAAARTSHAGISSPVKKTEMDKSPFNSPSPQDSPRLSSFTQHHRPVIAVHSGERRAGGGRPGRPAPASVSLGLSFPLA